MHVLLGLKNVRRLVQQIVEEFRHKERGPLVLLTRHVHLLLELKIVALQKLVLLLRL